MERVITQLPSGSTPVPQWKCREGSLVAVPRSAESGWGAAFFLASGSERDGELKSAMWPESLPNMISHLLLSSVSTSACWKVGIIYFCQLYMLTKLDKIL